MKRSITFLFVIVVFAFGLFSCNSSEQTQTADNNVTNSEKPAETIPAAKVPSDSKPAPRIVFESKLLELGKIGPEKKATGEYRFKNEGNAVLEISKISQCCGVVISYDKSKFEPGEEGVINVSYTSNNQPGRISRSPIVYSNDPVDPNVILLMTAEVVNKVVANPPSLKLFLDTENADCPKFKVSSTDGQSFAIRGMQSTGNCITAQFDPNYKSNEISLDLKADLDKLRQNKNGYIDIVVTHPEMSVLTVPFDVLSRFSVNPPKIIELNVDPGVPVSRSVWVFNKYNTDFEIESVTSQNNYITVANQSKVNNGYQIDIKIIPPPANGKTSFQDELYIQIKNNELLKIDCSGYYNPPKGSESKEEK